MSKRNFILLMIIVLLALAMVFGFFYFNRTPAAPGNNTGPGTNFISQFNPFGKSTPKKPAETTPPPADISGYQPNPAPEVNTKLKKISSMPVAGFVVFPKERLKTVPVILTPPSDPSLTLPSAGTGKKNTKTAKKPTPPPTEFIPALRYVDRATGNIYQTFADKIEERKFSTTVIPKIYEAFFGNKGDSVVMRYLKGDGKTIQTFLGSLPKELLGGDSAGNNEIKGSFLPENIKDVSLSVDGASLFYLFLAGDNMVGTTLDLATNKKVQLFDSPFTEWLSSWPNNKTINLTTKPASGIPGYAYALDLKSKNLIQVLGKVNGLTTLPSPDGKLILYGNDNLALNVYHPDTKIADLLGIKTLPEKCIWGKASDTLYCAVPKTIEGNQYPDAWYQGEVSFSDQVWKIDIKTGNATLLIDPAAISGGEEMDGIKLAIDTGENYLFFVNKKDSFLWELQLN